MFCPNCGTQNEATAAVCTKCNYQLKSTAAPKFKGTMMMSGPGMAPGAPAVPPPASPPPGGSVPDAGPVHPAFGAPPPQAAPAPAAPNKLKGTMVGVAPPMLQHLSPPPSPEPAAPAHEAPVNPLGGTLQADPGAMNFGHYGAPPPAQAPVAPAGGQYGAAPIPNYGGGYGAPAGGYGAAPGAAPAAMGGIIGGSGAYGAPSGGAGSGNDYAMQRYGSSAMQPYGSGDNGERGVVRNEVTVLLLNMFVPFYSIYWFITLMSEMKTFLKRDEPSWLMILLLSSVTCGLYALYWQIVKLGPLVQEIQQRTGVQNPQNHGILYIVPVYNVLLLQQELNKAWASQA